MEHATAEAPDWAPLVPDMVRVLRDMVDPTSRARMRCVCRAWRAADEAWVSPAWTRAHRDLDTLDWRPYLAWRVFCRDMAAAGWPPRMQAPMRVVPVMESRVESLGLECVVKRVPGARVCVTWPAARLDPRTERLYEFGGECEMEIRVTMTREDAETIYHATAEYDVQSAGHVSRSRSVKRLIIDAGVGVPRQPADSGRS
jgi:hypothetical protein